MCKIILTTLNSRFSHTSLGLRYLYANMNHLQRQTKILEFSINDNLSDIVEEILKHRPLIVGFGVYIWNRTQSLEIISLIKKLMPKIIIIAGGPELGHAGLRSNPFYDIDFLFVGASDLAFYQICTKILSGSPPEKKLITPPAPSLIQIKSPYQFYTDHDLKYKNIQLESSRGCPYQCEFCLSSLDGKVDFFSLDVFLAQIESLWQRGCRKYKFVDRTFNLNTDRAIAILTFFYNKIKEDTTGPHPFLHFEMTPDRLPKQLFEIINKFPAGSLQLEIGLQTLNKEVIKRVSRKSHSKKAISNIDNLIKDTCAHIHIDLIIGLPGESLESIQKSFDTLINLGPQEIQVGTLKCLPGTQLQRHDKKWNMTYKSSPPYELLQNSTIDFFLMQELKRFAHYWNIFYNKGNFKKSIELIWQKGSPFSSFFNFAAWLYQKEKKVHSISLERQAKFLFDYLMSETDIPKGNIMSLLNEDYLKIKGRSLPTFLKKNPHPKNSNTLFKAHKRQLRHINLTQN